MRDCEIVKYKNKKYCVCRYKKKNGTDKLFVVDANDLNRILNNSRSWYYLNGHIGYAKKKNNKLSCQYIHNLILNNTNKFKNGNYKIIHINEHSHDNRRANLKFVDQSMANEIKKHKKKSYHNLPLTSRIDPSDIPKCVHYCKPQSGHGEMFVIELIKNGRKYVWKSSSSKNVLLKDKLTEIKKKLLDISKQYPWLVENKRIIQNYDDQQIKLMNEFNHIIKLSKYKCAKNNLIKIPKKKIIKPNIDKTFKETRKYLKTNTAIKSRRRHTNNLPSSSGIIPAAIPKHCYYQPATNKRGDAFVIDRHPHLPKGKRLWTTTTSRRVSTKNKFGQLKKKLRELSKEKHYTGSKTTRRLKK
jgi:hypothetical protein